MSRRLLLIFGALLIPVALVSQMASKNVAAGTWKLNIAKSKWEPSPVPSAATLTVANDGSIKYSEEFADGKSTSFSVTPKADGTPATIEGMGANATLSEQRMDDRHVSDTWKIGTVTLLGKGVISRNGKTFAYTLTGTNADGKSVHHIEMYEKQ